MDFTSRYWRTKTISLPAPNRVLPVFRRWILRDVGYPHPAGMVGRKPPDGSVIAQGEEPARGCADLDDPSHASTTTRGYFPNALRASVAITPTLSTVCLSFSGVTPSSFVQYRSS
jgi:hypothetical protein